MGLHDVAHVMQAHMRVDILTLTFLEPLIDRLELQVFHQVSEAEEWLRSCQGQTGN